MYYLVFDTETTGLPKNYQAPLEDFDNWPRLVQLAWQFYDGDGNLWEEESIIVKPEGFTIPEEVAKIHRVSQERAMNEGVPLDEALNRFADAVSRAHFLVGHNIDFDDKIVGSEFLRSQRDNVLQQATKVCTMKLGVNLCRLPGRSGFKWPNLAELHQFLFQENFSDAHDALVDVKACARCFFEMKRRGIIN
ncbi:MAG: 3'-5' exonuclease [Candidatus Falkowbacteria bacterium]|nr:3'-5' exonuclease [Candidatus Falkowbacteria bacterium]